LLIIDEFGKGTQPEGRSLHNFYHIGLVADHFPDGAGLLAGVLEHLLNLGEHCPKVVASTHFHGYIN
jgi:DNA mismatch repair protein MSH5